MKYLRLLFLAPFLVLFASEPESAFRLSQLALEDQFGVRHSITFPREKWTILTAADQAGSDGLNVWINEFKSRFGTNVYHVGIADVRKVPTPLRSFVRNKFKKKYSHPVLLDWTGSILERLDLRAGEPNIFVVSMGGELIVRKHGDCTAAALAEVAARVNKQGGVITQ